MTLQEAKDQVAKDCGFEDWEHIFSSYNLQKIEQITDEAAELYARSKWDEAVQLRQSEVINQLYARITELESKQKTDAGLAIDKTRNDREARILDRFLKQSKDAN